MPTDKYQLFCLDINVFNASTVEVMEHCKLWASNTIVCDIHSE